VGYNFSGDDFDTEIAVNDIPGYINNYVPVGACPDPGETSVVDSLSFGGDVKFSTGTEYTAIDLQTLSALPGVNINTPITIGLSGNWFNTTLPIGTTFSISVSTVIGGTMFRDGTTFGTTGVVNQIKTVSYDPQGYGETCPSWLGITQLKYYPDSGIVQLE
jgi:hypothetical protein